MSRKECPQTNVWPTGCKHWVGKDRYHPMGCCFDIVQYAQDGYGPFYENTECCRLGSANMDDAYEVPENFSELAKAINVRDLVGKLIAPERDWPEGAAWIDAMIGIHEAVIESLQQELDRWKKFREERFGPKKEEE